MPTIDPAFLRSVSLFALFNDEEFAALVPRLRQRTFEAGHILFQQHEPGGEMYIVQSGRVELFIQDRVGEKVTLGVVDGKQVFGEMSLFENHPRSASARTLEPTDVLMLGRDDLTTLIYTYPNIALRMLEILAQRVRTTNALVQDRVVTNVNDVIEVETTLGNRISDFITNVSGNMYFVGFSLVWFIIWIIWNLGWIPGAKPFDPFPFGFLTVIVSLEMVFLSLFILIKQARQAANDKVRNDIEYEVNVRAEMGVRDLSKQVEHLERLLSERLPPSEAPRNGREEVGSLVTQSPWDPSSSSRQ